MSQEAHSWPSEYDQSRGTFGNLSPAPVVLCLSSNTDAVHQIGALDNRILRIVQSENHLDFTETDARRFLRSTGASS